jgi:hypothetical protein
LKLASAAATAICCLMMSGRDTVKCREPTYGDGVMYGQDKIVIAEFVGRVRGKTMISRR